MAHTIRQTSSSLKLFLGLLSLTTHVVRPVLGQTLFESLFEFLGRPCNSNEDPERCGGNGYVMRIGTDGSIDCQEKCAYFPIFNFGYTCGSCAPVPTRAPSLTAFPIPAPSETPPTPITPSTENSYEITMDLVGSTSILSASDRRAFTESAGRWESIITTDILDIDSSTLNVDPKFDGCVYPAIIDDLYICIRVAPDDGVDGTLGYASPSYRRPDSGLTAVGYINLDVDDVEALIEAGTFAAVFSHEIGHILGIGTYFVENGVAGTNNQRCPYYGTQASAEFAKISRCDVVPLENSGRSGDGTYCSHWDEECIDNELMTGVINYGGNNPLSRISIGSLEDLGYPDVDYSKADRFTALDLGNCDCRRRSLGDSNPMLRSFDKTTRSDKPPRRKLSEETRQYAYAQGLKFLRENQSNPTAVVGGLFNKTTGTQNPPKPDGAEYVGDRMVSVLVRDGPDGDIYGVHVYNPDYEQ